MFLFIFFLGLLSVLSPAYAETPPVVTETTFADDAASKELSGFYALRGKAAAWNLSDETSIQKAQAFVNSVEALIAYHGLEKSQYQLDNLRQLIAAPTDENKKKLEFAISQSLLHLAHDLHGDNHNLAALYPGWSFHRSAADIPALLNKAITQGTLETFFDKIAPQNPAYRNLTAALQIYREIESKGGWSNITLGAPLRPQDKNERVGQLRARLAAEGYLPSPTAEQNDVFDSELEHALISYQARNGLQADGHAGAKTQEALNVPIATRLNQIIANMERWRHMPDDFPPQRNTIINIPDFTITITEDGALIYQGIVVDGRIDRATPFISSKITNMMVNPSWHVPLKIARKDILPKLQKDSTYLEKQGIVIAGREEDPSGTTIDWKKVKPAKFSYLLRQNPSDMNSLGQLKFNFLNPFDVYMHGTPHQELFAKAERSFSSGCVRLEEPEAVAEILLMHNKDKEVWSKERIEAEIASEKTHLVMLAKPMPVYFVYWSVFAGSDGLINFRKDIYGYDDVLINKMKGH